MNTRRFIMHLIVGLLTFLIGVAVAVALGSFNPLTVFSRSESRQYTIPTQSLSTIDEPPPRYNGCPHSRPRMRTAEMHRHRESLIPPPPPAPVAPVEPVSPFVDEDEAATPEAARARR